MFIENFLLYFYTFNNRLNGICVNQQTYDQLEILFNYLYYHFELCDDAYNLYIKIDRGSFTDNYTQDEIESMSYYWECSKQELENQFYKKYPYTEMIHKITIKKYDNGWFILILDEHKCIQIDPNTAEYGHDLTELISFIFDRCNRVYDLQVHSQYEQDILNKIKYNQRFGTIQLKHLYEFDPDIKKNIYNHISNKEIKEFIDLMNNPVDPIRKINLNIYLSACNSGYLANKPYSQQYQKAESENSMIANYLNIADGRHDGMIDLNIDSYDEFEQWLNSKELRIGHPFEVVTSMDISNSIHLYPYNEGNGYVFLLSNSKWHRTSEIIRFALAINRLGYPVRVDDYQKIIDRLNGYTMIGICPDNIFAYWADSWFNDIDGYDFSVNLYNIQQDQPDKKIKNFIDKIKWFPTQYSIKKE